MVVIVPLCHRMVGGIYKNYRMIGVKEVILCLALHRLFVLMNGVIFQVIVRAVDPFENQVILVSEICV